MIFLESGYGAYISMVKFKPDKYYYEFIERFELIAEQPYLYQAVDYIRQGYRRSVCGVDNIYYRIVDGNVEIMNIIGQQDIDEAL